MDLSIENPLFGKWACSKVWSKEVTPPLDVILWRYRFWSHYGRSARDPETMRRLRMLFGAHGSGADWLVRALAHFDKSMPCFHAPSERVDPPLIGEDHRWLLPLDYRKELDSFHPFGYLLKHLSLPRVKLLKRSINNHSKEDSTEIKRILVHEPNALLMPESLARTYSMPMILMVTDPVYCADRYLASQGDDNSEYLQDEFAAIKRPGLLLRFFKKDARRVRKAHKMIGAMEDESERKLYSLVLTLGAINRMFRYISAKYHLMHCVSLADFLHDTSLLRRLAGIYCNEADQKMLAAMSNYDYEFSSEVLVPDLSRRPRVLDSSDINQAYRFLSLAGLEEPNRLLAGGSKQTSIAAA